LFHQILHKFSLKGRFAVRLGDSDAEEWYWRFAALFLAWLADRVELALSVDYAHGTVALDQTLSKVCVPLLLEDLLLGRHRDILLVILKHRLRLPLVAVAELVHQGTSGARRLTLARLADRRLHIHHTAVLGVRALPAGYHAPVFGGRHRRLGFLTDPW